MYLVPSHHDPEHIGLVRVHDLHVTDSALLPLPQLRVEAVELAAAHEGRSFLLLARNEVDFVGELDDGLEMDVALLLGVSFITSVR